MRGRVAGLLPRSTFILLTVPNQLVCLIGTWRAAFIKASSQMHRTKGRTHGRPRDDRHTIQSTRAVDGAIQT
jgi:hypothetical protein